MNSKVFAVYLNLFCIVSLLIFSYSIRLSSRQPYADVWIDKDKARKLLKGTMEVLHSNNIHAIPMYETLLGLVRHEGVIPWDESSIYLYVADISAVAKLQPKLLEKGISLDGNILHLTSSPAYPLIELSSYGREDKKVIIERTTSSFLYKFEDKTIFPLKTNLFEGIPIDMPNNPDVILKTLYGKDWENICVSGGYQVACKNIKVSDLSHLKNGWVINLANRKDRLQKAIAQLEPRGITTLRWNATDAKSPQFLDRYAKIPTPKVSAPEIACGDSHRSLWKHLYDKKVPYGLIFEDDILFPEQIGLSDIENALINSPGFDIILLGHCGAITELFTTPVVKVGSANCTHAYIISREGMRKMLETPEKYDYPIDKILTQMCSSSKLLCFVSKHVPMVGSNIGGIIHQDTESASNIR